MDSNHRTHMRTDLQSAAFSHSATYPYLIFKLPLTRFELVASPLPRECATPAPQRLKPQGLCENSLTQLGASYQSILSTPGKKPVIGIEPTTYGLQNRCSTIEPLRLAYINNIKDMKFSQVLCQFF